MSFSSRPQKTSLNWPSVCHLNCLASSPVRSWPVLLSIPIYCDRTSFQSSFTEDLATGLIPLTSLKSLKTLEAWIPTYYINTLEFKPLWWAIPVRQQAGGSGWEDSELVKRSKPACPKRNRRVLHVSESKVLSSLHSQHPNPIIHWSQLSFPTPDYPVSVLLCGGTFHFSLWPRLLALTASLPASLPNSPSMTDHFHISCLWGSLPWFHPSLLGTPMAFHGPFLTCFRYFYSLDSSNICHCHVRFLCHRFIKDLLCLGKYARDTLRSQHQMWEEECVHSAYEKQTPVFIQTATHTRDMGIWRLSESVILTFTVRKWTLANFDRTILPDIHGC